MCSYGFSGYSVSYYTQRRKARLASRWGKMKPLDIAYSGFIYLFGVGFTLVPYLKPSLPFGGSEGKTGRGISIGYSIHTAIKARMSTNTQTALPLNSIV